MSRLGRSTDKKGFIFSLDKPPIEPGWRRINGQCVYTPTCDYGGGDCYATQAECLATLPGSSSSSSAASSSSSSAASSSSSSGCGPFDSSLTTVLGANSQIPDLYYAVSVGMVLITAGSVGVLEYDNLGPAGLSLTMEIRIGGQAIGMIQPGGDYNGRPFAFNYQGIKYCGNFQDGPITF